MRRIIDADIQFLSLCPLGKNGLRTLYKSDDQQVEFQSVTKELPDFDERGELVACVWAPNRLDADKDFCDEETVVKLAHSFMRNSAPLDIVHNCETLPKEAAYVAESFIIQKDDPRFSGMTDYEGEPVDVTGGWGVVVKVEDPDLRKAYREGEWQGVSMYGPAKLKDEPLQKADMQEVVASLKRLFEQAEQPGELSISAHTNFEGDRLHVSVSEFLTTELSIEKAKADELARRFVANLNKENEMKLTDEQKAEIGEMVKASVAEALATAAPAAPPAPEPKPEPAKKSNIPEGVDFKDPAAVQAHARDTEIANLAEATDWADPESIKQYNEKLADIQKAYGDGDDEGRKAAKSNAKPGDTPAAGGESFDAVKSGKSLAEHINKGRGYIVAK